MANGVPRDAITGSRCLVACRSSVKASFTSPVTTVLFVAAAMLLGGCSQVRWVAITTAIATDPAATSLTISIDGCVGGADLPNPRVIESETEVHLLIDLKLDYGDMKACISGTIVHLAQPIGTRRLIDDRSHRAIPVTWSPITTPVHLAGSVHELLGQEGDATVTAWLLIDRSGVAVLCDELPSNSTTCPTATMGVDWETGGGTRPTDLHNRGDSMVSAGPISLHGSLKADTLFVGVVP